MSETDSNPSTLSHVAGRAASNTTRQIPQEDAPQKRDLIAGLEKGLQVIEAFDQERSRLTISEVARRID